MPSKEPVMSDTRSVASTRLPTFGAEASIGQASRFYRSPMSYVGTGHAVAPSQWADSSDTDVEAEGSEMADEVGEAAEAADAGEDMEASDAEEGFSITDDGDADPASAEDGADDGADEGTDDSDDGGDDDTESDEQA